MSDIKAFPDVSYRLRRARPAPLAVDPETALLAQLARQLGPRDIAALAVLIRRASEIEQTHGEETALAVLDQIEGILEGRTPDA